MIIRIRCATILCMQEMFTQSSFPSAPGGHIYLWKSAETAFKVNKNGKYIIAITASARNAEQNNTKDDDDLRAVIDGYEFGKKEIHQDKVSWKGFGVAASWDGASLRGGKKTVYFFLSLSAGDHLLQFWADEKPAIHAIHVFGIEETQQGGIEDIVFDFQEKALGQKSDVQGIPWKSFVFAPGFTIMKLADITVTAQSAKQKGLTDADNVKVYVNGKILRNPKALTSDKYKNFFFSGDLSQGKKETLMISGKEFLMNEQDVSIELWYDETPILEKVKFEVEARTAYEQPNTLKRRIINASEALHLPFNLWNKWSTIAEFVGTSREAALFYAERHGFIATDQGGGLSILIEDNEPDALRHFTWNVLLTQALDSDAARVITTLHEVFWMELKNKKELSRSNVQDLWNNNQGRAFALKYSGKGYLELFEMAKVEGKLILKLEDVTEEHRKAAEMIVHDMQAL